LQVHVLSITHFREWRKFNLGKERNC